MNFFTFTHIFEAIKAFISKYFRLELNLSSCPEYLWHGLFAIFVQNLNLCPRKAIFYLLKDPVFGINLLTFTLIFDTIKTFSSER